MACFPYVPLLAVFLFFLCFVSHVEERAGRRGATFSALALPRGPGAAFPTGCLQGGWDGELLTAW